MKPTMWTPIALIGWLGCSPSLSLQLPDVSPDRQGTIVIALEFEDQTTVCGGVPGFETRIESPNDALYTITAFYYSRRPDRLPIDGIDGCPVPLAPPTDDVLLPPASHVFRARYENGAYTDWAATDASSLTDRLRFFDKDVACPQFSESAIIDLRDFDPGARVTLLEAAPNDQILVGTNLGQLGFIKDGQLQFMAQTATTTHYTSGYFTRSGQLWLGRVNGTIVPADPNSLEPIGSPWGSPQAIEDRVVQMKGATNEAIWALFQRGRLARYTPEAGWQVVAPNDGFNHRRRGLAIDENQIIDVAESRCNGFCDDPSANSLARITSVTEATPTSALEVVDRADRLFSIINVDGQWIAVGRTESNRSFYIRTDNGWVSSSLNSPANNFYTLQNYDGGFVYAGGFGRMGYHDLEFNQTCTQEASVTVAEDLSWLIPQGQGFWTAEPDDEFIILVDVLW